MSEWTSIPDRTEKIKERLTWQTEAEAHAERDYVFLRDHWLGDEGDFHLASQLVGRLAQRNERLGIQPWLPDWKPSPWVRLKKWWSER